MLLIIIFLTLFLAFFIFKKTRSYVYALIAGILGFIIIPLVLDGVRHLVVFDNATAAAGTVQSPGGQSTTPSVLYRSQATSCSCNG